MKEEEITYREAIVKLAGRYSVGGINPEINKPGFESARLPKMKLRVKLTSP